MPLKFGAFWGGGGGGGGGGGDPELGLRDLAALRSQTFAISSYPF